MKKKEKKSVDTKVGRLFDYVIDTKFFFLFVDEFPFYYYIKRLFIFKSNKSHAILRDWWRLRSENLFSFRLLIDPSHG